MHRVAAVLDLAIRALHFLARAAAAQEDDAQSGEQHEAERHRDHELHEREAAHAPVQLHPSSPTTTDVATVRCSAGAPYWFAPHARVGAAVGLSPCHATETR